MVTIDNYPSNTHITCCVPQPALSPISFSIYIVEHGLQCHIKSFHCYAYDTQIYLPLSYVEGDLFF